MENDLLSEKLKIYNIFPPFSRHQQNRDVFSSGAIFYIYEQVKTNISAKFGAFIREVNVSTIILLTKYHTKELENQRKYIIFNKSPSLLMWKPVTGLFALGQFARGQFAHGEFVQIGPRRLCQVNIGQVRLRQLRID